MLIGLDLGGTNIKGGLFDDALNQIGEIRLPTQANIGSARVLENICHVIDSLLEQNHAAPKDVQVMGMGIPGLLDPQSGISFFSPNFDNWENVPIVSVMQERYPFPVFIDNDVRVHLYGEWKYGAGKGVDDMVLLAIGTGLGSGLVSGGRIVYGDRAGAGELGHTNMFRTGGRPCRCGSSGCLGRYVSAVGMVRTFTEALQAGDTSILTEWTQEDTGKITAAMISDGYDAGDDLCIRVMRETGELLGFALTNVINLLNPRLIIVGGGMSAAGERLLSHTRKVIDEHALKLSSAACRLTVASLGDGAAMLGAAAYGADQLNDN